VTSWKKIFAAVVGWGGAGVDDGAGFGDGLGDGGGCDGDDGDGDGEGDGGGRGSEEAIRREGAKSHKYMSVASSALVGGTGVRMTNLLTARAEVRDWR
jgi:hypothetical protein